MKLRAISLFLSKEKTLVELLSKTRVLFRMFFRNIPLLFGFFFFHSEEGCSHFNNLIKKSVYLLFPLKNSFSKESHSFSKNPP